MHTYVRKTPKNGLNKNNGLLLITDLINTLCAQLQSQLGNPPSPFEEKCGSTRTDGGPFAFES